jgi:3-phosphoshikimate 1-carboxyvinyltransferase
MAPEDPVVTRRVRVVDGPLDATVHVPGSKSIANRALVCAALAAGDTVITDIPAGDDTAAMLDCLGLLGAGITIDADEPSTVRVRGTGGALRPGPMLLQTRLAGTTSRFVTALAALGSGQYEIDGDAPLRARPMGPLHDALATLGAHVTPGGDAAAGHLPVVVTGLDQAPGAHPASTRQRVAVAGDVSSQFITALMLIAPYLPGGLEIELTTSLVSRPYVTITKAVMAAFGADDVHVGDSAITVGPGVYESCDYAVEPDASSASYPLAAAAICGGTVTVASLGADALQGDAAFADVLAAMGCTVTRSDAGTTVTRAGDLTGVTIDMADLSDLVPTLAVVAPFATSPTVITGVAFIRAKESDRLGDLARELRRVGIAAIELDDGLRIEPGVGAGTDLDTHDDHRLAMAFGVLGLRVDGIGVRDPGVVSKSWPDFWNAIDAMVDR